MLGRNRPGQLAVAPATALFIFALASAEARADCNSGADYIATVKADNVQILLQGTARMCGGPIPMLRENTASGQIVELANECVGGQYVDECVPPGTYRYGFATPYDCSEQGCGGEAYYVDVTVPSALGACTTTPGVAAPVTETTPAPWASSSSKFIDCPSGGCSASARSVLWFDLGLAGLSLAWLLHRRRASR